MYDIKVLNLVKHVIALRSIEVLCFDNQVFLR